MIETKWLYLMKYDDGKSAWGHKAYNYGEKFNNGWLMCNDEVRDYFSIPKRATRIKLAFSETKLTESYKFKLQLSSKIKIGNVKVDIFPFLGNFLECCFSCLELANGIYGKVFYK